ncbi:MAG: exodeoxyribonuclease V subunit gamma [Buchnera aphidicola (Microlophium carnosum)]|uniref:RecBCD enzyme subunit RecC n=1 Tax=Buchnera aphidicola (Microlophium carnosum) TaxID=2708354 RepID=A0A6G9JTE0_9GAMM|nr:MAG: exodeoxyribonuclease V subunit gamma [Buchnera aphidicola (Microlophium carnosum)]
MFIVYKSNSLDILLLKACNIITAKPLSNIFEKEVFVYDGKTLFQYLNIFFAEKIGISANFQLYHPHDFIWRLFQIILSKKDLKNIFTHSMMVWKIMNVLDNEKFLENYKKKEDEIKKFKFSFLMANIFEQYIFYRPNWINEWETKKNASIIDQTEAWQRKLWMEIMYNTRTMKQSIYHFAKLFDNVQKLIKEKKIKKKYLPKRCFVISSFSLNPSYIKFFKDISIYINVYFLYVTPCKNNIFHLIHNNIICLDKKIEKKNVLSHSLMMLWGQYEKIYSLYVLKSKKVKIINCFKKNKNNNLLNNIQNDLLDSNKFKTTKRFLQLTDNSISIHICLNKKNEIEILYEKLLVFFHENSSLKPSDIVVTSFSLNSYILFINAIFKSVDKKKNIPFFISQKFPKNTRIILSVFKKILNLSNSRFENEEILELLEIPEIAKKFNFSKEEIKILYSWIEEANICWAIDCKHKDYLSFPKNKQNTWFYGIEKLLLSYAMNDTETIWNNILSCSLINGSRSELIGKLIIFIKTLEKWQRKLSKSQYLEYWHSLSTTLMSDFFYPSKKIEKIMQIIQKKWIKMMNDNLSSNYSKKISINILKKNFFYKNDYTNNKKFLPGVVNFCHPDSVCYIPFKIICIIGADHSSIPKINYLDNFNLLIKYPLIGDVNIYQKYCYLFAQSISCAEKKLHISYIGYSDKDESKRYPSVLVDQLLNYIAFNFCFIGDENLNLENNAKKIIKNLCTQYNKQYFYEKKNINFFKKDQLQNTYHNLEKNIYDKNLLKKQSYIQINLKDLINFWKNPIRYFFNFNLKIRFNTEKKEIKHTEPFSVHPLDAFKIKTVLLNKIIHNQEITEFFQYHMLSGKLPYHFFGKIFWNKSIKDMTLIAKEVMKYRVLTEERKINLKIEKYQINGILCEIQNTGLLRWKPTIINYSDRISLWLEHLIYSVLVGCKDSRIIGYKCHTWSFSSLNTDIAYTYLLQYIRGYIKGIKTPLFLIKSGASWLDQVYDKKNNCIKKDYHTNRKGHKKLLETWIGNSYMKAEQKDFYIKQTITTLNTNTIKKICEISEKWLTPILKYKKINKK